MDAEDIARVQSSFAAVRPISETAAKIFYGRLFEIARQVRPMFKTDMDTQGRKLMATLGTVVNGLDRLEAIAPVARDLAIRHVAFGVKAEHYPLVGAALLWTLGQGLGEQFTPEMEAAWTKAYMILSGVMIGAAYPA